MGIMKLCDSAVKDVAKELQRSDLSGPVGLKVAELFRSRLNWFEGLQTKKQEISSLKKILGGAWVEPVQRLLGSRNVTSEGLKGEEHSVRTEKDYCWDIPLVEQIRASIQQNQVAWKDILESSKRWSSTEPRPPPVTIADIPDGNLTASFSATTPSWGSVPVQLSALPAATARRSSSRSRCTSTRWR